MKIDEIKIEDAADANYVIRKFFNNQFTGITMGQLEQLVLTVYNMGKNKGGALVDSESPVSELPPQKANPFKINDRVKTIEDIEIGRSGALIKANTVGKVSSVKEDAVSFLFESDEDGEMIETSVMFDKLEKVT